MRYLNFSKEEIKEFRNLTNKKFAFLIGAACSGILLAVLFIFYSIRYPRLVLSFTEELSILQIALLSLSALIIFLIPVYLLCFEFNIRKTLNSHRKKIYLGIIAEKKIKDTAKEKKYYLYMDGKKFRVNESEYLSFEVGQPAEFHVSSNGKYLFKVCTPETFIPHHISSPASQEGYYTLVRN